MFQIQRCTVAMMFLATIVSLQSLAAAEEFNLENDWERFYNTVQKSDVEQTLAIRNSLAPNQETLDLYVRAHLLLAARLTKLESNDETVETLERALLASRQGRPVSDSYAVAWSLALDALCRALAREGEHQQILVRLAQFKNQVSGYAQQASYARIQLSWNSSIHGTDAVTTEATTTLAKFAEKLPSEPTAIELTALLRMTSNPACFRVPLTDRVTLLIRCRDIAHSSIRKYPSQALAFFRCASDASYEVAKLYVRSNGVFGDAKELVERFEQCRQDLLSVASDKNTSDFVEQATNDFRSYVERRIERFSNPEPLIYESPLIGKKAPDFTDLWVVQGRIPEPGGGTVILLDFWETWCGPCIAAFPKLTSLDEEFGDKGLRVVGVAGLTRGVWDNESGRIKRDLTAERGPRIAAMKAFVQNYNLPGDELVDETGAFTKAFGVHSFPTYVLIDRLGNVELVAGGGSETMVVIEKKIGELLRPKD